MAGQSTKRDVPAPAATKLRETLWLVIATDCDGSAESRERHLSGHLDYIERHIARYAIAGPSTDGASTIDASVLLVRASDAADARALIEGDPYFAGGVWARLDVRPMRAVCGTYIGGVTW